ncbi:hypothetical protein [Actinomadura hibisca]|uniref:hypothetical protein n=1 Tax=Actinomadura hibisca TaxID=68565 RepID=UPI00082E6D6C|nr:hypothetical protein [Actinomadura hibisca]
MTEREPATIARLLVLALVRQMFPRWDIWICDQGVWRAAGPVVISASSSDGLLTHLAGADAEAIRRAAHLFSLDA